MSFVGQLCSVGKWPAAEEVLNPEIALRPPQIGLERPDALACQIGLARADDHGLHGAAERVVALILAFGIAKRDPGPLCGAKRLEV